MEKETKICPKCGGEMIKGKIKDSGYIVIRQQRWTSDSVLFGVDWKVDTFACKQCKYLESYLAGKEKK